MHCHDEIIRCHCPVQTIVLFTPFFVPSVIAAAVFDSKLVTKMYITCTCLHVYRRKSPHMAGARPWNQHLQIHHHDCTFNLSPILALESAARDSCGGREPVARSLAQEAPVCTIADMQRSTIAEQESCPWITTRRPRDLLNISHPWRGSPSLVHRARNKARSRFECEMLCGMIGMIRTCLSHRTSPRQCLQ